MTAKRKVYLFILVISFSTFISCVGGLDPISSEIKDLSMSWSIPIGKADVKLIDTYPIGFPNNRPGVPAWAQYDTLGYSDTVPLDLSKIFQENISINKLGIKINVWNEYPVGCFVDCSFMDEGGAVLYSFWGDTSFYIKPSDIGIDGTVVFTRYAWSELLLNQEQIKNLETTRFLKIDAKLILSDAYNSTWKFYYFDTYKLTCQVASKIDLNVH